MATTGELLQEARTKAGLTRAEVAERSGVAARTIEKIEQGVTVEPKLVDVAKLAAVYGLTCADFLPTNSPPPPAPGVGRPVKPTSNPPEPVNESRKKKPKA